MGLIQSHTAKADNVTTLLPNLMDRFGAVVGNLANIPRQHVDKARNMLKGLLGSTITLHPCDGTVRYLTAEVTGDYAGLLRLAISKNKSGGGHPQPALFCPTIRVPLRPTKLVAGARFCQDLTPR